MALYLNLMQTYNGLLSSMQGPQRTSLCYQAIMRKQGRGCVLRWERKWIEGNIELGSHFWPCKSHLWAICLASQNLRGATRTQYDETNHAGSKNKTSDQQKIKSVKRRKCPPCGRLKSLALEPQLNWCWATTTSRLVSGLPLVLERASMSSLGMTLSGGSGRAGDVLIIMALV